jgi:hypothetical protein
MACRRSSAVAASIAGSMASRSPSPVARVLARWLASRQSDRPLDGVEIIIAGR